MTTTDTSEKGLEGLIVAAMAGEPARQAAACRLAEPSVLYGGAGWLLGHWQDYDREVAVDLALFVNGLPVATFELKNSLTKQTVEDAVEQYRRDRDPRELLFQFGRCMVHFAVAAMRIALPDADAEIGPVPASDGGALIEPELDRLSNILRTFNDQFGAIAWTDADRVRRLITEEIPDRVAADAAYQNARKNPDRQNARIEHDKALGRVILALMKDDTELFKQFSDNDSFRRWLTDAVFDLTYVQPGVASYR